MFTVGLPDSYLRFGSGERRGWTGTHTTDKYWWTDEAGEGEHTEEVGTAERKGRSLCEVIRDGS